MDILSTKQWTFNTLAETFTANVNPWCEWWVCEQEANNIGKFTANNLDNRVKRNSIPTVRIESKRFSLWMCLFHWKLSKQKISTGASKFRKHKSPPTKLNVELERHLQDFVRMNSILWHDSRVRVNEKIKWDYFLMERERKITKHNRSEHRETNHTRQLKMNFTIAREYNGLFDTQYNRIKNSVNKNAWIIVLRVWKEKKRLNQ